MLKISRNNLQLLIYLSAILLCASVFLPLANFRIYGDASFYRVAKIEACLVIIFTLTAPGCLLAGRKKTAIVSPVAVWIVLFFPTIENTLNTANNSVLQQMGSNITGAMSDLTANLLFKIGDYHWGGFVFLFALLSFTLSNVLYRFKL